MEKDNSLIKKVLTILLVISLFFLIIFLLKRIANYSVLIILTIIFSYLFSILTTFFRSLKINLFISKILSILVVFAFLGFIIFILIPPITNEVAKFIANFESVTKNFSNFLFNLTENLKKIFENFKYIKIDIDEIYASLNKTLVDTILNIVANFFSFLNLTLKVLIEIIFAIIISIFFIFDRERFLKGVINELPEKYKERFLNFFERLNISFKRYIAGQFLVSSIIGLSLYIFLIIFNIPYAGTLAFIAAVAEVILYIGPIFTFILGLAISFTVSPLVALWFSLFYIFQQQITTFFVYPLVWSKYVLRISPVVVFITMIVLLSIFGPISLFFTVPVIILFKNIYIEIKGSNIYEKFKKI